MPDVFDQASAALKNGDLPRLQSLATADTVHAIKNQWDGTLMHCAAVVCKDSAIPDYLLSIGGDFNAPESGGGTPLYFAVYYGNPFMVQWLCDKGFYNTVKCNGYTPMEWAVLHKREERRIMEAHVKKQRPAVPTTAARKAGDTAVSGASKRAAKKVAVEAHVGKEGQPVRTAARQAGVTAVSGASAKKVAVGCLGAKKAPSPAAAVVKAEQLLKAATAAVMKADAEVRVAASSAKKAAAAVSRLQ